MGSMLSFARLFDIRFNSWTQLLQGTPRPSRRATDSTAPRDIILPVSDRPARKNRPPRHFPAYPLIPRTQTPVWERTPRNSGFASGPPRDAGCHAFADLFGDGMPRRTTAKACEPPGGIMLSRWLSGVQGAEKRRESMAPGGPFPSSWGSSLSTCRQRVGRCYDLPLVLVRQVTQGGDHATHLG